MVSLLNKRRMKKRAVVKAILTDGVRYPSLKVTSYVSHEICWFTTMTVVCSFVVRLCEI
jgi:hypothetical protein